MIGYLLPERSAVVQQQGHPAAGVIGWIDRSANTSGVHVDESSALTYSAVWAASRVISETVASLPCILYRRLDGGGKERARDDNRFSLVHDSPNDMMTPYGYFETLTAHMALWGNGYSRIVRISGEPAALEVRLPNKVHIKPDDVDSVRYEITDLDESLRPRDVVHVAGPGFDGVKGYSVIRLAAQSLGTAMASEQYAGSFFGNGATPAGAIVHPQRLSKEHREAFRKEWNEIHKGGENSNKVAILHGGIEYKPIGMSNEDAQFLESRQFSISEVARWFRLPPHMLGDLSRATFSNIEHMALEFVTYSIAPWLRRWETTLNKKLLLPSERGSMFFEFMVDSLLRGDIDSRYNAYATARQWGWMSVNEIRERENMNPVDNGDVFLQPMNMGPAGDTFDVPDSISAAWRQNLEQSISRILDASADVKDMIVELGYSQAASEVEEQLQSALSGIHDQQDLIRRELSELGQKTQVAVLEEVARLELQQKRHAATEREAAAAIKAAEAQEHRGEQFLSWLDSYTFTLASRKRQLLACADGPAEGFADRVRECVAKWTEEGADELPEN